MKHKKKCHSQSRQICFVVIINEACDTVRQCQAQPINVQQCIYLSKKKIVYFFAKQKKKKFKTIRDLSLHKNINN